MMLNALLQATLLAFAAAQAVAQDPRVKVEIISDLPVIGISTTEEGRTFALYRLIDGSKGPALVEYNNGTAKAYPNEEWNTWSQGQDVATHFVRLNSQRIGPDGLRSLPPVSSLSPRQVLTKDAVVYLVDTGSPASGQPVVQGGPKIIQVNLTTNSVTRVYPLDAVAYPFSFIDDIRFNGPVAYITDAKVPGIIILDRESGYARRVLNGTRSTTSHFPASAEGRIMMRDGIGPFYLHADQLEVSPDGQYFYYQALTGGMYRIETCHLADLSLNDAQLESLAVPYASTPTTGGTAIDAEGNIYSSDITWSRLLRIAPDGTMTVLLEDPRLIWIDGMWIDKNGKLWMPVPQVNNWPVFHNGTAQIQRPLQVLSFDIGVGPSPIDHN